ncbi:4353_t:CDS:2, partial [Gigaspora rosea]
NVVVVVGLITGESPSWCYWNLELSIPFLGVCLVDISVSGISGV